MLAEQPERYVAFAGGRQMAAGTLRAVIRAARTHGVDATEPMRIFSLESGDELQADLRGTLEDVLARLRGPATNEGSGSVTERARPGRPKLGVVAKEVTLLPRHWAWLATQRGSVSATLRRLIDEARHTHGERDAVMRAQDGAYRFVSAMAAGEPTFEEAVRALYRGDAARFDAETAAWPPDVRDCARRMAGEAFAPRAEGSPSSTPSVERPERR